MALGFDGTVQAPKIIVGRVMKNASPFLPENSLNANKPASLVLVGDTDWLYDGFAGLALVRPLPRSRPINDNHNLFLNLVELSAGSDELLEIRSRKVP